MTLLERLILMIGKNIVQSGNNNDHTGSSDI